MQVQPRFTVARLLTWINAGTWNCAQDKNSTEHGSFDMSETIKSEAISRRKALSLMGLAAALGLAAASTAATLAAVTDAEAQTIGMERRHERRHFRRERRFERRVVRHVRRAVRRHDRHY
jgi:hypothetical protein